MPDTDQALRGLWQRRNTLLSLVGLSLLCTLLYANTLDNGFVLDDDYYIVGNYVLRDLGNIWQFVDVPADAVVEDLPPGFLRGRNIRWLTYAIDYALGEGRPFLFHLSNLVWHLAVTCGLFFLARYLSQSPFVALATAALFAAHPIQTAAVSYISGRKDILAAFFVLMTFLLTIRYRESHNPVYFGLSLGMLAVGYFSKESAVVFPCLLLWADWCRQERLTLHSLKSTVQSHWGQYLAFFAVAGLLLLRSVGMDAFLHATGFPGVSAADPSGLLPVVENRSYANLMAFYLMKLVWPFHLLADYRGVFAFSLYPAAWGTWLSPVVALACGAFAVLAHRRQPLVALGFGWIMLALLPVSHLVPLHYPVAEHYLYLPAIGFSLLAGGVLGGQPRSGLKILLLALVLAVFTIATVMRNGAWQNMESMTLDILRKAPSHAGARNTLVHLLIQRGDYVRALIEGRLAVEQDPFSPINHYNLGIIHAELGDIPAAEQSYRRAIALQPNLWDAYLNLGDLLLHHGRVAEGTAVIDRLTSLYGYHPLALWVLANQKAREGAWGAAEALYRRQLAMDRHSASGYLGLAGAAWHLGRQDWRELLERALEKGLDLSWAKGQDPWQVFLARPEILEVISKFQHEKRKSP